MSTSSINTAPTNKVFLWGTPRSCSTAILKCISHIEGTQAWFEPYFFFKIYGRIGITSPAHAVYRDIYHHLFEEAGGKEALTKIEDGIDSSSITSLQWIRDTLNGEFPELKLVFVKEIAENIFDHMDLIPAGFNHAFLIRHPYRVALGLLGFEKSYDNFTNTKIRQVHGEASTLALMRPMKFMYAAWDHITKKMLANGKSVIIDADDLLDNPSQMMEKFCQAVDIPFSESILTWEAGDAITHQWMTPKEWFLTKSMHGNDVHKSTFASTGFEKRFQKPLPSKNQFPLAWHSILDEEMEYYKILYSKCLRI